MNRILAVICAAAALVLLPGCAQAPSNPATPPADAEPAEPTEGPPEPTAPPTEVPTAAPPPTPEPTPTETPWIFRDDFDGELAEGWRWVNEIPARVSFTDYGWLEITADNPGIFNEEGEEVTLSNLLVRDIPEGDFAATVHLEAAPSRNFQQATLYLIAEIGNYVAVNTGFCEFCIPETGGHGFYVEAFDEGNSVTPQPVFIPRDPAVTDVYLRLAYRPAEGSVAAYYASAPDEWQEATTVTGVPAFTAVGLGAANIPAGGSGEDLVARFDYFELSDLEDGP